MDRLTRGERSENMRRIRSRDTSPELLVRSLVHRLGFRFRLHRNDLPGKPDLVFHRFGKSSSFTDAFGTCTRAVSTGASQSRGLDTGHRSCSEMSSATSSLAGGFANSAGGRSWYGSARLGIRLNWAAKSDVSYHIRRARRSRLFSPSKLV